MGERERAADTEQYSHLLHAMPLLAAVLYTLIVLFGAEIDLGGVLRSLVAGSVWGLLSEPDYDYIGSAHFMLCTWMLFSLALAVAVVGTLLPSFARLREGVRDLLDNECFEIEYEKWLSNRSILHPVDIHGKKGDGAGATEEDTANEIEVGLKNRSLYRLAYGLMNRPVRARAVDFKANAPVRVVYVAFWLLSGCAVAFAGINALPAVGPWLRCTGGALSMLVVLLTMPLFWRAFAFVLLLRNLSLAVDRLESYPYLRTYPEGTELYRRLRRDALGCVLAFLLVASLITIALILWMLLACQPVQRFGAGVEVSAIRTVLVPNGVCGVHQSIALACSVVLSLGMASTLVLAGATHMYLNRILEVWHRHTYDEVVSPMTSAREVRSEVGGARSLAEWDADELLSDEARVLDRLKDERSDLSARRVEVASTAMGVLTLLVQIAAVVIQATL